MSALPPEIEEMKARAKIVRHETGMSYGHALDLVAKKLGYADWNAASARASTSPRKSVTERMRNRVVLQVILDYRKEDCLTSPAQIVERFHREHNGVAFNEDYLNKIASMNPFRLVHSEDRRTVSWELPADLIQTIENKVSFELERSDKNKEKARETFRMIMRCVNIYVSPEGKFAVLDMGDDKRLVPGPKATNLNATLKRLADQSDE